MSLRLCLWVSSQPGWCLPHCLRLQAVRHGQALCHLSRHDLSRHISQGHLPGQARRPCLSEEWPVTKKKRTSSVHGVFWERLKMTPVALFYAPSQVHREGDLGRHQGRRRQVLGRRRWLPQARCALWSSRNTHLSELSCESPSCYELSHGRESSTPVGVSSPSLLWSSASGSNTCASGLLSVASASASGA